MMKSKAFTLVELLAVIAVTAILMGLLLVVLGKVRDGARSANCASNLRQIGAAMQSYAYDHEMKLPSLYGKGEPPATESWMQALAPYAGLAEDALGPAPRDRSTGIFVCPEFDEDARRERRVSYAMNAYVEPSYGREAWDYSLLNNTSPPTTFLVVECDFSMDGFSPVSNGDFTRRHPNDSANVLFADGHIENITEPVTAADSRWYP